MLTKTVYLYVPINKQTLTGAYSRIRTLQKDVLLVSAHLRDIGYDDIKLAILTDMQKEMRQHLEENE